LLSTLFESISSSFPPDKVYDNLHKISLYTKHLFLITPLFFMNFLLPVDSSIYNKQRSILGFKTCLIKFFLETEYDGKERHERRIRDIERIEENN